MAGMAAGLALGCLLLVGLTLVALMVLGDLRNQEAISATGTAVAPLTLTAKALATTAPGPNGTTTLAPANTPPPHLGS